MIKNLKRKRAFKVRRVGKVFFILFCLVTLFIMSTAYAVYIKTNEVSTVSKVYKPKEEVLITSVVNNYGCGYEMQTADFTNDSITVNVEIADLECSIFYEIKIKNNFDIPMQLLDVVAQDGENGDFVFILHGFEKEYFILPQETITMMIEIKYNSSLYEVPINNRYRDIIEFVWGDLDTMKLVPRITYSEVNWTNRSVIATLSFNQKNITITNNDGNNQYVFDDNGEFVFEYDNYHEDGGLITAKVNWIDKELK